MRTSNPAFNNEAFAPREWGGIMKDLEASKRLEAQPGAMSLGGTVIKTAFSLGLCIASALIAARMVSNGSVANPMLIAGGGAIGGFIVAMIITFSPRSSPFLAPLYAVLEGAFLGTISLAVAQRAGPQGSTLVLQAVTLTFGVFAAMLLAYGTGLIRATPMFTKIIVAATLGIALTYLASFIMSFFGITLLGSLHGNGAVGIGFSLLVVGIAAFNLVLDFDLIEQGVRNGAAKHMEWYGAFALLTTLVWLYLEILRLLSKLKSRD
jgi:uncharacterized YccA/Bax inhibitor family protein